MTPGAAWTLGQRNGELSIKKAIKLVGSESTCSIAYLLSNCMIQGRLKTKASETAISSYVYWLSFSYHKKILY